MKPRTMGWFEWWGIWWRLYRSHYCTRHFIKKEKTGEYMSSYYCPECETEEEARKARREADAELIAQRLRK